MTTEKQYIAGKIVYVKLKKQKKQKPAKPKVKQRRYRKVVQKIYYSIKEVQLMLRIPKDYIIMLTDLFLDPRRISRKMKFKPDEVEKLKSILKIRIRKPSSEITFEEEKLIDLQ